MIRFQIRYVVLRESLSLLKKYFNILGLNAINLYAMLQQGQHNTRFWLTEAEWRIYA